MLRKLRPRSIYDVFAVLALLVAMGGTGAYAANEWTGDNIVDESLTGADVKGKPGTFGAAAVNGTLTGLDISGQAANAGNHTPFVEGSLTGDDVKNSSLIGADIANSSLTGDDIRFGSLTTNDIGTQINLAQGVPSLPANNCINISTDFAGATPQDHVVVTPSTDAHPALVYEARAGDGEIQIHVCNFANATINDGQTHFNIVDLDVVDD